MSAVVDGESILPRLVLIACGSFSPPTPMHFRMFEIAKDHFETHGTHKVIGGIASPTHDSYGKKGLTLGKHRYAMVKLALQTSSWIRVSDWEITQDKWTPTRSVLQYHQNFMNNYINSPELNTNGNIPVWLPSDLRERPNSSVQLKLLCGADLLESFAVSGLWADRDIEDIVANHGLVVISRSGSDAEKFIFESDILSKYQSNITLVTNWVPNEVSSSMIRRLLSRGLSVKYLLDDLVMEYILQNRLFDSESKYITNIIRQKPQQNLNKLTSINQINMNASSSNENTPSDDDGADDLDEDNMDETDYSIKSIFTSINLDNRKARNVFCCGETKKVGTKLLLNRSGPGQAVQVVTSDVGANNDRNTAESHCLGDKEFKAKKIKITAPEQI